jgi:hypothetical protein
MGSAADCCIDSPSSEFHGATGPTTRSSARARFTRCGSCNGSPNSRLRSSRPHDSATRNTTAAACVQDQTKRASELLELTRLLDHVMLADLPGAIDTLISRIQTLSAVAASISSLMNALPPLAMISDTAISAKPMRRWLSRSWMGCWRESAPDFFRRAGPSTMMRLPKCDIGSTQSRAR